MFGKAQLWQLIEPCVTKAGLRLFDIELPGRRGSVLRVYISRPKAGEEIGEVEELEDDEADALLEEAVDDATAETSGEEDVAISENEALVDRGGITVSHCSQVSRRILRLAEIEELLPGRALLEVSSPGINRRLTLRDHFEGATGERIKISFEEGGRVRTLNGTIIAVRDRVGEGALVNSVTANASGVVKGGRTKLSDTKGSDTKRSEQRDIESALYVRLYGDPAQWEIVLSAENGNPEGKKPRDKKAGDKGTRSKISSADTTGSGEAPYGVTELVIAGNAITKARVDYKFGGAN